MPHGYYEPKDNPLIYNEDCSMRILSKKMRTEFSKDYRYIDEIMKVDFGYETNYLCMLKRVDEFIKFINTYDSEAIVFIQGDHGALGSLRHNIFSLGKVSSRCEKFLSNQIDNINAIRLSLSCATNQKVKLLKQKSFSENLGVSTKNIGFQKVFLVEKE